MGQGTERGWDCIDRGGKGGRGGGIEARGERKRIVLSRLLSVWVLKREGEKKGKMNWGESEDLVWGGVKDVFGRLGSWIVAIGLEGLKAETGQSIPPGAESSG